MGSDLISIGSGVIRREAEALGALERSLGESFGQAVRAILEARGRAIVSGMGKSGHIARKIAATLASTGTPAHFVHPAEASHGDLGMLAGGDVAILLSNSGETAELADIMSRAKGLGIPLVGIAGQEGSALMRKADIALLLPKAEEACGRGIVPTTSTTMMLALGDAIAVALMELREFTPENFREFHPGGRLGARLLLAGEIMHSGDKAPLISEGTGMPDAILAMSKFGFGVAGVVDGQGLLSGVITDGDLRRHMSGLLERKAAEVMTPDPITVSPGALAQEALGLMNEKRVTALFCVSGEAPGKVEGILHIHDCLRAGLE